MYTCWHTYKNQEGHVPTFLYAFPYDKNKVFLQETHLVARNHRATCKSLEVCVQFHIQPTDVL